MTEIKSWSKIIKSWSKILQPPTKTQIKPWENERRRNIGNGKRCRFAARAPAPGRRQPLPSTVQICAKPTRDHPSPARSCSNREKTREERAGHALSLVLYIKGRTREEDTEFQKSVALFMK